MAIFRHGDRAPLKITNDSWHSRSCIKCTQFSCPEVSCDDGLLTTEGYQQAKKLGSFIKNNYLERLNKKSSVNAFHSSINRSLSTLNGVIESLGTEVPNIKEESCLLSSSVAVTMKNIILSSKKYAKNKEVFSDYYEFDKFVSSYCSDIPYDCSGLSCDVKWIANRYKEQLKSSLELIEMARQNIVANGLMFGKFADFVKTEINKENNLTLISGHDSNIIKTLQGLNIHMDSFPPYISSIFLEVWKDPSNLKYVKVNYQGKEMKFGLYSEKRVTMENFNKYLDIFVHSNKKIDEIVESKKVKGKLDTQELEYLAEKAKEIYSPIKKDIEANPLIKIASSLLGKINYFYSFFRPSLYESRSFFFSWLKKNKELIKMQIKSVNEDGDEVISTMECDKGKKSDCKVVKVEKTGKKGSPNSKPQVIAHQIESTKNKDDKKDTKLTKNSETQKDKESSQVGSSENKDKDIGSGSKNLHSSTQTNARDVAKDNIDTTNQSKEETKTIENNPCEEKKVEEDKKEECGCKPKIKKPKCDMCEKTEEKECPCSKAKVTKKPCDSCKTFFKGGLEKKFATKGCNVIDDDVIKQLLEKNRPIQTDDCESEQTEKPQVPTFNQMTTNNQQIIPFRPQYPPLTQPIRFFTSFFHKPSPQPCFRINAQGVNVPCNQAPQFIH